MNGDGDSGFGVSHLASTPITTTFAMVLLAVLVLLIVLRLVFADVGVSVRGGAR